MAGSNFRSSTSVLERSSDQRVYCAVYSAPPVAPETMSAKRWGCASERAAEQSTSRPIPNNRPNQVPLKLRRSAGALAKADGRRQH